MYPKAGPSLKRAHPRFRFGGTFGSSKSGPPFGGPTQKRAPLRVAQPKSGPPSFMYNLKFQENHVLLLICACKGTNIQPEGCAPWTLSLGVFSARTKPEIYKEPIVYWPSVSHGRRLFRLSYFVLVAYWFPCANYWSFWPRPNARKVSLLAQIATCNDRKVWRSIVRFGHHNWSSLLKEKLS